MTWVGLARLVLSTLVVVGLLTGCVIADDFTFSPGQAGSRSADAGSSSSAGGASLARGGSGGVNQDVTRPVSGSTHSGATPPGAAAAAGSPDSGATEGGLGGNGGLSGAGGLAGANEPPDFANPGGAAGARSTGGMGGNGGAGGVSSYGGAELGGASETGGVAETAGGGGCPDGPGPQMVRLPSGCIDSTEVTRGQYEAWLSKEPNRPGQDPTCAANDTFEPEASCMSQGDVCQGDTCVDHPVVCVDWCDALAFCEAAGKRLCGKIGGSSIDYDDSDLSVSQWWDACSSAGKYTRADGESPSECHCNTYYNGEGRTVRVRADERCQSPADAYGGVYYLSGNVNEWEDSCEEQDGGAVPKCHFRGGAFDSGDGSCSSVYSAPRDAVRSDLGFRCCAP